MENVHFVLNELFKNLNLVYSKTKLKKLCQFDTGDNLLTLKRIAKEYNVNLDGYQISRDDLADFIVEFNFSILNTSRGWVVITEYFYKENQLFVKYKAQNIEEVVDIEQLKTVFTGIAVSVKTSIYKYKEKNLKENLNTDRQDNAIKWLTRIALAFILFFAIQNQPSYEWYNLLIPVLILLGIAVSYFLIVQNYGSLPTAVSNFCNPSKSIKTEKEIKKATKEGKETVLSCNQVNESKSSYFKLFGITIRNSEVSFFFFLTAFLLLFDKEGKNALIWLAISSLPIGVVSIYTQVRLKAYCPLCLLLVVILTSFQIISFFTIYSWAIPIESMGYLCIALFITVLTRKMLSEQKQKRIFQRNYSRTVTNRQIIERLLTKKSIKPNLFWALKNNILRAKKVNLQVTFVTNPYCKPCSTAHQYLHLLPEDSNVSYLFTWFNEIGKTISIHLMALSIVDEELFHKTINKWYELLAKNEVSRDNEAEALSKLYEISHKSIHSDEILQRAEKALEYQREWLNAMKIEGTPTLFFNEYELPREIDYSQLFYVGVVAEDLAIRKIEQEQQSEMEA